MALETEEQPKDHHHNGARLHQHQHQQQTYEEQAKCICQLYIYNATIFTTNKIVKIITNKQAKPLLAKMIL